MTRRSTSFPHPLHLPLLLLAIFATPLLALVTSQSHHNGGVMGLKRDNGMPYGPPVDNNDAYNPDFNATEHSTYNPDFNTTEHSSIGTSISSSSNSSGSSSLPTPTASYAVSGDMAPVFGKTVNCQQPLATFVVTHAAIIEYPLCGTKGQSSSNCNSNTNGSSQLNRPNGPEAHAAGNMENLTITLRNPAQRGADIHCHVTWDTNVATSNKFPIAKQMDCDQDEQNQLNAVVQKQASGVAAGFFVFVWNNNQMETMATWMVRNITTTGDAVPGWSNGANGNDRRLYFNGATLLNSMPAMLLSDFLAESRSSLGSALANDP